MSYPQLPEPAGSEPSAVELSTARDPRLGVAYAVTMRNEGGGENSLTEVVLTYRLRRWGPDGRELAPLQVEMRGPQLKGMIADGDLVQATEPLPPSGATQLETVTNLTTGSQVTLKSLRPGPIGIVILVLVVVFFLVVFGFILLGALGLLGFIGFSQF